MAAPTQRVLVAAAVAALIGIWGTTWGAIKISLDGFPPFAGLGIRFIIAGVVLFALAAAMRVPAERGPRLYKVWAVETLFGLVISYGLAYWAIESTVPSGMTSLLFSTFPLFVAVLAHVWLPKEPVRWGELAGIGGAVAGVAVLFSDDLALPTAEARGAALLFLLANVIIANRSDFPSRRVFPLGANIYGLDMSKYDFSSIVRKASLFLAILGSIFAALAGSNYWEEALLFMNGQPAGIADPLFKEDISLYLFRLPLLNVLSGALFALILAGFALTAVNYLLRGGIASIEGLLSVDARVKRNLPFLISLFI